MHLRAEGDLPVGLPGLPAGRGGAGRGGVRCLFTSGVLSLFSPVGFGERERRFNARSWIIVTEPAVCFLPRSSCPRIKCCRPVQTASGRLLFNFPVCRLTEATRCGMFTWTMRRAVTVRTVLQTLITETYSLCLQVCSLFLCRGGNTVILDHY